MSESLKDFLIKRGGVSPEDYTAAELKATKEGISLMHAIEILKIEGNKDVLHLFSSFYRIPKAYLSDMDLPESILDIIPRELAIKYRLIPIDRAGNNVIVATGDPRNVRSLEAIKKAVGYSVKPVLASEVGITEALDRYYRKGNRGGSSLNRASSVSVTPGKSTSSGKIDKSFERFYSKIASQNKKVQLRDKGSSNRTTAIKNERKEIVRGSSDDGPVIKLVNTMMVECLRQGASDVHVEPYENFMRIRLRIDGALHLITQPPSSMKGPLISRIKIMADMNIAETRLPQDGSINIRLGDKPIDFRVNTIPTVHGEKVVMRVLDKSNLQVDLTQLGFEPEQETAFKDAISRPHGMLLVTGPTGSGKTTTLYSALQELNKEDCNIMTAEDPVEYSLPGINQVQMKNDIGLDFAESLKSFLRQDPDIIMVGEIRDYETATIAIKAALTGHFVLSTLHTNSAVETISRLLNMGVESFNLVSALSGITAQRLVRCICTNCRVKDDSITPQILVDMGVHPAYAEKVQAYKGVGCSACDGHGTKGRAAVHEVLVMNDAVKQAIMDGNSTMQIKEIAVKTGMRTLRQSALNKMVQGICSAEEVVKVTAPDKDKKSLNSSNAA